MRAAVGHVDRTAEAEFGLVEEIGKGVLDHRRQRAVPAQHAAVAHGMDFEVMIGRFFQLPVGRMIFDPLLVLAEPVAVVQHRRIAVGGAGEIVQVVGGPFPQTAKVRAHMRQHVGRGIDFQ